MRATLLLDDGTPKVPPRDLRRIVLGSGIEIVGGKSDFGIVVGGDGRFSRYGRTEDVPLLLVGVRAKGAAGSKARLAETTIEELPGALARIKSGDYSVVEHKRLGVFKNGRNIGEVFTDVYMQRGNESTCIRYNVKVSGPGTNLDESAIGDGIVIATKAGSTGYYSYPDRIKGEDMDPDAVATLDEDEVGICHVNPTYVERSRTGKHPLRYAVPWGSRVNISLFREADARLYGVSDDHAGVPVELGDRVTIAGGKKLTRLISFK